jgi:lactoylglutathione lyase
MVKLSYMILYVRDVTRSIEFYEAAFGFKRKFIVPGNSYGELDTGNTTLSFATLELATSNLENGVIESSLKQKPFACEIGMTTDDVEGLYKHAIKCGAIAESAPAVKSHGQTVSYVRDPDGFLVEICTPMG